MGAPEHLKPYLFKPGDPNHPSKTSANSEGQTNYRRLQRMFAQIFEDPAYWTAFKARAIAGKLPPAVEVAALHYYGGKPKDVVDVNHKSEVSAVLGMQPQEVLQRHQALSHRFAEIQQAIVAAREKKEAEANRDGLGVAWADEANMPKRPM